MAEMPSERQLLEGKQHFGLLFALPFDLPTIKKWLVGFFVDGD